MKIDRSSKHRLFKFSVGLQIFIQVLFLTFLEFSSFSFHGQKMSGQVLTDSVLSSGAVGVVEGRDKGARFFVSIHEFLAFYSLELDLLLIQSKFAFGLEKQPSDVYSKPAWPRGPPSFLS